MYSVIKVWWSRHLWMEYSSLRDKDLLVDSDEDQIGATGPRDPPSPSSEGA